MQVIMTMEEYKEMKNQVEYLFDRNSQLYLELQDANDKITRLMGMEGNDGREGLGSI